MNVDMVEYKLKTDETIGRRMKTRTKGIDPASKGIGPALNASERNLGLPDTLDYTEHFSIVFFR